MCKDLQTINDKRLQGTTKHNHEIEYSLFAILLESIIAQRISIIPQ